MLCFSSIHVLDDWEIFPAHITREKLIGEGAFGNVFLASMDASLLLKSKYAKQYDGMPLAGDKNVKVAVKFLKGEIFNC